MIRKQIDPGARLMIKLSVQERDVVVERAFLDRELAARLRRAESVGTRLVVHLTLDDIDDLHGCVAAEANHCQDRKIRRLLDSVCDRLGRALDGYTDELPAKPAAAVREKPPFTAKQGQYLAFAHYYTKVHRRAPAEADFQRYFQVSPPTVHAMITALERRRLIERTPGQARSIRLLIADIDVPPLS